MLATFRVISRGAAGAGASSRRPGTSFLAERRAVRALPRIASALCRKIASTVDRISSSESPPKAGSGAGGSTAGVEAASASVISRLEKGFAIRAAGATLMVAWVKEFTRARRSRPDRSFGRGEAVPGVSPEGASIPTGSMIVR